MLTATTFSPRRGTEVQYDVNYAAHRGLGKDSPQDSVGGAVSVRGGEFGWYDGETFVQPNGKIIAYGLFPDNSDNDNSYEEVKDNNAHIVTVSPTKPFVGNPNMALWINGTDGPYLEIPNNMDYALGEVFVEYTKEGDFRMECPEGETIEEYVERAREATREGRRFRLINYGILPLPATKMIRGVREVPLYDEEGNYRDDISEEYEGSTDVLLKTSWYEFEVIS